MQRVLLLIKLLILVPRPLRYLLILVPRPLWHILNVIIIAKILLVDLRHIVAEVDGITVEAISHLDSGLGLWVSSAPLLVHILIVT